MEDELVVCLASWTEETLPALAVDYLVAHARKNRKVEVYLEELGYGAGRPELGVDLARAPYVERVVVEQRTQIEEARAVARAHIVSVIASSGEPEHTLSLEGRVRSPFEGAGEGEVNKRLRAVALGHSRGVTLEGGVAVYSELDSEAGRRGIHTFVGLTFSVDRRGGVVLRTFEMPTDGDIAATFEVAVFGATSEALFDDLYDYG